MNAAMLLEHFQRIGDGPDAVPRLRRFVLDLAVRGKLVPQDPVDEPASELLNRIVAERARFVKAGEISKQDVEPIAPNQALFEPPANWTWTRIGEICSKTGSGSTPLGGQSAYHANGVPFLRSQNIYDDGLRLDDVAYIDQETHRRMDGTAVKPGDLLLNITGGSIGRCCLVPTSFAEANISQHVAIVRVVVSGMRAFLHRFILSPYFQSFIFGEQTGAGRGGLPKNRMDRIPVALPPLAEQHRIVVKVDALMVLCDRLVAARAEREARRDRLAAASLARLNAPDPDPAAFADHARFALDNLAALTTRPDQVKQLRQTILDLAVRGKLVLQDPNDEPASELLKRIADEKARLVKAGKVKKEKPLDLIDDATKPYDLPDAWEWVRLDVLTQLITKGSSPKWQGVNYVSADEGILFITSENVGNYELRKLDDLKYVESRFRDIEPRSMLKTGDILMNLVGASIGRTALYNLKAEANINQAVALVRLIKMHEGPYVDYLLHYFNSRSAIEFMLGLRVTTAQPNMSLTDAREFPVPLPPLAEQHRIVAKVDALMALCNRLEASLDTAAATRRRLLDALLAEALAPAVARECEMAE